MRCQSECFARNEENVFWKTPVWQRSAYPPKSPILRASEGTPDRRARIGKSKIRLARVFQRVPFLGDYLQNHCLHHSALLVAEPGMPQRNLLSVTRVRFSTWVRKCTETPRLPAPPPRESPTCLSHFLTVLAARRVPCCHLSRGRESAGKLGLA